VRRRTLLGAGAAALAGGRALAADPAVVTLFGDSIVAGFGLAPEDGLAAQLQASLAALGVTAVVRNAGIPGETSAQGRARVTAVRRDTAVCVVEFGGNDARLGYPVTLTHDSLDAIVRELKARGVTVILMLAGRGERAEAARQVASENRLATFESTIRDGGPGLLQADGIHPNAAGERILAQSLAATVALALRARADRTWNGVRIAPQSART
jgi:acyl-CoA thioesterase-1